MSLPMKTPSHLKIFQMWERGDRLIPFDEWCFDLLVEYHKQVKSPTKNIIEGFRPSPFN